MALYECVGKLFSLNVREQIPVCSERRPVFAQPLSFGLSHRVVAERILPRKTGTLQNSETLPQLSKSLAVVLALCGFASERHGKPQSVLPVTHFCVSHQPIPIHVNVCQRQPWQTLSDSGVKVRFIQCVKQDSGWVLLNLWSEIRKSRITQSR